MFRELDNLERPLNNHNMLQRIQSLEQSGGEIGAIIAKHFLDLGRGVSAIVCNYETVQ